MPTNIRKTQTFPPKIVHVVDIEDDPELDQAVPQTEVAQTVPLDRRPNRDHRIGLECFEVVSVDTLKPNGKQAKKHSERQVAEIAGSIEQFGFNDPIEVDENSRIVSGYGRYLAAKQLGMKEVPVIRYSHLSLAKQRAYAIAANKIAEHSEWDLEVLGEDFKLFNDPDINIDPRDTAFTTVEIDNIFQDLEVSGDQDSIDDVERVEPDQRPVTKPGDMWQMDEHWLLCADAREPENYDTLMGAELAQIVFMDSPYNVPNQGHVSKRDGVREFAMAGGEMSAPQFIEFQDRICVNIRASVKPGAVIYTCIDHRHLFELRAAADRAFGPHKNMCVWVKTNAGMGTFYRSQHEIIMVYVAPGGTPTNNFRLGGAGRHRSNVWEYPGLSSFGRDREKTVAMHPTVKPVAMVEDALRDCSNRGEIVLDPFGGSGTTLIAAERTGRKARLIEIDPLYCDCTVRRWQKLTGKAARLADGGATFDEVESRRGAGQEGGRT
jgi:hypothetical protein